MKKLITLRNKIAVLVATILLATIMVTAMFPINSTASIAMGKEGHEMLVQSTYTPTLKDDFKDDRVIVTLKPNVSRINSEVRVEDFVDVNAERAGLVSATNLDNNPFNRGDDTNSEALRTGRAVITDLFRVDDLASNRLVRKDDFFQILSIELTIRGKDKVLEAIAELEKSDMVFAAEPCYNLVAIAEWTPNDTDFAGNQWGLTGSQGIRAEAAWDITSGNQNVRVGVMEEGIDGEHEDLIGRVVQGNFTPGLAADLDHGTHVAGIIGAISNNNHGISGVAQVSIVPLNWNDLVAGVNWAANNNVPIINMSFGYYQVDANGVKIAHAGVVANHAAAIWNYNGLIIAAAGNGLFAPAVAQNSDNNPHYPSSYSTHTIPAVKFLGITIQPARPITNVISVGAINENATRRGTSNFGTNSVQIYAPGTNIRSTVPTNAYANWGGTSMAAPMVAGVAALLRSFDENISVADMKAAILNNGNQITINAPGIGNHTVGSLNAHQSLSSIAFTHTASGNNATITGINFDPTGELVIPTLINGRTVTKIGNDVFGSQEQLTNITIPNSVINLNNNTFHNNTSVYWVGNYVFRDNIFLESLNEQTEFTVPDVIAGKIIIQIGDYAFEDNTILTKVTIPSSVAYIGDHAFSNCTNLSQVEISDETTSILGSTPFSGCIQLYNTVVSIRTDYHRIIDDTGRLIWTAHDFVYDDNHSSTHHDLICVTCGFEDTKSHNKQVVNGIEVCSTCPWVGDAHVHHEHTHSYIPIPHSGKFPVNLHKAYCFCGEYIEEMCLGRIAEDGKAYCIHCGRDMTGALGQIINRILLSESDFHDNDIYCIGDGYSNDCCITKDDLFLSELKNVLYMDVKRRERSFYGGA